MTSMKKYILVPLGFALIALAFGASGALAQHHVEDPSQASGIHPTFPLLDAGGLNVLTSGRAISTAQTCGQCHDTEYIGAHSFHSNLSPAEYAAGNPLGAPGSITEWNPLTYRYQSRAGDDRPDLGAAEWLRLYGERFVGGGTATPEVDCFVCHLEKPNIEARVAAIRSGKFIDASTATLVGRGLVEASAAGWTWNAAAFTPDGEVQPGVFTIQDPTNENCAQCHGLVHPDGQAPLTYTGCELDNPLTATTGQIIASQKISESGMNVAGKAALVEPFDIHAARQLQCTDCHFSPNNPSAVTLQEGSPSALSYDPRRLELGEYLTQPDHNLAHGQSPAPGAAVQPRCDSCHDAEKAHGSWLPAVESHMAALACETCHIPQLYAPAIESYDWTVISPDGKPRSTCRGVAGAPEELTSLVAGYSPTLLNRNGQGGDLKIAPYNLITSYYWAYDAPEGTRPVRIVDLQAAYFEGGKYRAEIVSAFDANANGRLEEGELLIDSQSKSDAVAARLSALGLQNPRIEGTVQPYAINHDVVEGRYALNECKICHGSTSRPSQPTRLSGYAPGGVAPHFDPDAGVAASGQIVRDSGGALYYQPATAKDGLYIFGASRIDWIDWLGGSLFLGTVLGIGGHGTLRYLANRKHPRVKIRTGKIYMYEAYERFWHWLQAIGIVILLLTGLVIHRPSLAGFLSYRHVVAVHNILAALLILNAALSLFYHLTTGQIRQYLPRPYGFFEDAIVQAKYYMQGIFRNDAHPFAKTPEDKLNPLQRITYFGILNVLLPLQGLTGILMWVGQKWPELAGLAGGLPFLAPFHTLTAWLFAAFILGHVYLTTTGTTPLEATRGMITGWERIEAHDRHADQSRKSPHDPSHPAPSRAAD